MSASRQVKPAKITPISESYWLDEYVERVNPRGQRYFWLENGVLKEEAEAGTDAVMIQQGHLTVSFVGGFVNNNALYYPKLEEILG